MSRLDCDVVVLGAGPGGALAAALCAARGIDVVVIERGEQRGTHLPESWVGGATELMDGLRELDGAQIDWRKALRPRTTVRLRSASSGRSLCVDVRAGDHEDGVALDRVAFDALLVEHTKASGATVLNGFSVTEVVPPDAEGQVLVRAASRAGKTVEVVTRVVLDASGKSAVIGRRLGLLEVGETELDPREAVFTHIEPARPTPLTTVGTTTVIGTAQGYLFVVPIDEGRVSVGVVVAHGIDKQEPGTQFEQGVPADPEVAELVASGRRLLPVIPALNRTYRCRDLATAWYGLVGDAAAFTDPFACSGLDLALRSGARAATLCGDLLAASTSTEREAAAKAYREEFGRLLDAEEGAGLRALADGSGRELLNALTDPHLPPLLPVAAHAHGTFGFDGWQAALAAGRRRFAGQGEFG
ncbi:NAD(P)/FAD-dependent oxidoreductase [Kribbella sp. CA-253562]|uniref:NAD(P)/FAD-dependent oxidoreductase n=1 Tax=Kribbella sp. CA-253562 TaxID=3239942 RepID=UPI003D91D159